MSKPKVKFDWNKAWVNTLEQRIGIGLYKMATDISKNAQGRAPVLTGNLKASIVPRLPDNYHAVVTAGNARVPYAYRREHENKLHPDKKYYMRNALNEVMQGDVMNKYFGGLTKV